ncbi:class I SAM-dependent methyltransferase [Hoeflea sp. TYP-13]|uniref:class I SAM-dependent methyltransferase n=1 Tax=Hoeflea sp. TYP-13 TaxID=3230023 RepID=UPI0034C65C2E
MSKKHRSEHKIVDDALNLDGQPEHVQQFYDDWAENYEKDVDDIAYAGPSIISGLVDKHAVHFGQQDRANLRVLDAGCGTGLAGKELHGNGFREIHGFDLSPEMAARAASSGFYQSAAGGIDLMKAEDHFEGESFDIIVSVGVFTLGHVPPEALEVLARLVRPGGLLVLSTRIEYYDETNYRQVAAGLIERGQMRLVDQLEHANYTSDGSGHFWVYQISR